MWFWRNVSEGRSYSEISFDDYTVYLCNRFLRLNHIDSGLMRAATVFPEGKNVYAVITSKCSLNELIGISIYTNIYTDFRARI